MSVEKILFSDLIDLHSVNEESRQLKIDKKYIYKRENRLYFLNINFNFVKNYFPKMKNQINFKKDGITFSDYIPENIFEEQNLELYFYYCYFPNYIYGFGKTAKLCYKCSFDGDAYTKGLIKKNCTYKNIINGGGKGIQGGYIEKITLKNHTFENNFYLNNQDILNNRKIKIKELIITNTIFSENFKLHNCEINNILIRNVDFEKHADFYKSNFKQGFEYNKIDNTEKDGLNIYFKAINFKGLAIFRDCTFQEKIIFEWVTFESFSHFRRTKFNKGLDLDYTNIEEEMNFFSVKNLDSKASKENTSQETYRIIKHNFEKIGNKIEANKYHALELEKRKVDKKTPPSERLVLGLHWFTSRNGTNWWIPLLLIFLVGLITMIGLNFENPFSYYPQTRITSIEESFFEIFKHIYILYKYKELWDLHPFLLAFNKFSLGYLYYQFLIAVRKDTRK